MSTLAQFRLAVSSVIGTNSTAGGAEEALVDKWVNQGVVDFLLQTRCNINVGTITLTAGAGDYTLGTAVMGIQDVTYQASAATTTSRLIRTTPDEILNMRQSASSTLSVVGYYALNGNDLLMLFPTPETADTVTVYYTPRPTALSVSSHDPSNDAYGGIPSEYHDAIEFYGMWKAADFDDDQSSKVGLVYRQYYDDKVRQYKRAIRLKGGRSLGRVFVGRRGLRAGNRSQDIGVW